MADNFFGIKSMNLSRDQIASLVEQGLMSPEQGQMLAPPANTQAPVAYDDISMGAGPVASPALTGSYSQDQIARQMQAENMPTNTADSNLALAQQAPEAFNATQSSLAAAGGTGPSMPGPVQAGAPGQVPAIEASPEQVMAGVEQATAADAQRKVAGVMQAKAVEDEAAKAAHQAAIGVQQDSEIAEDSKKFNWGRFIGQAASILVGAKAQQLTGSKTNPAIDAIDKEVDRQAATLKYNDEKRLRLADQAYKQAQLELDKKKATIDNMATLRRLEQTDADLAIKRGEIQSKLAEKQMMSQSRFSDEQVRAIPVDQREKLNLVRLPGNAGWGSAMGAADAQKLRQEILPNTNTALRSLKQLEDLTDYFGNNPAKKVLSREQKGVADQAVQELVGAIRLDYFGPGVLTDNEQEIARSMIGNPSKFWSLSSANRAKLQNMAEKMKFSRRVKLRESGIDMPLSRNETILQQAKQKYPGSPDSELINALIRQGKWDRNEQ